MEYTIHSGLVGVGCVHRVLGMQYQVLLHTHAWSTPSIPLYPPGINYYYNLIGVDFYSH
jgi:hypothetical protein